MRKAIALLVAIAFLTASVMALAQPASSSTGGTENTWVPKAPMPQARAGLGVAVVDGKIYAIGGTTASGTYPPDCFNGGFVATNEQYDPATDTWTTKASMPTPRDYFAIAAYGNKVYCIGGAVGFRVDERTGFHSYNTSGVIEVYDTVTNTWETKTPFPDVGMGWQAHVVNGKIYILDGSTPYVYDPETDVWSNKTRMPKPYPNSDSSIVSAAVGTKIVVTFDFSELHPSMFTSHEQKVWIYDTETDSWSAGKTGTILVFGGAAVATTGMSAPQNVYVLGLERGHFPAIPTTNQVYDVVSDAWETASGMPTRRKDFGAAVVNDIVYVIGGHSYTSSKLDTVAPVAVNEQYTPIGYGTVPPVVEVVSPVTHVYNESSVSLVFTLNKPVNWTGYSLDGGENVTVAGNTTISGLPNGLYNVTVYAKDAFGNTGVSETVSFTVAVPFPTVLVVAPVVLVVVVGVVLAVYFKRRQTLRRDGASTA